MNHLDLVKPAARSLVVAARLPAKPKNRTNDPFTADGDMVVDCSVAGCGWHAIGPRTDMKKAINAHHRMFHSQEVVVTLLNNPRL